ncbi:MAG: hypothetical protein ABSC13_06295 [Dehalococcoidia bacterium]|jgi:hypothetical protein
MKRAFIMALGAALLVGCGGSASKAPSPTNTVVSDPVLHLNGFDALESAVRLNFRVVLLNPATANICRSLQGLSSEDVAKTIDAAPDDTNATSTPYPGLTPVPGQTALPSDRAREGTILQEECSRILMTGR